MSYHVNKEKNLATTVKTILPVLSTSDDYEQPANSDLFLLGVICFNTVVP